MSSLGKEIARAALKVGAIRLSPSSPFTWVSGYRMPIYNDNRRLLSLYENRRLVSNGFAEKIKTHGIQYDLIAGTATAGISPATTLADLLETRFVYVRKAAKDHGVGKRIEGIAEPGDMAVLVEDLISTGGSSVSAVTGLREEEISVEHCLAIFSYGFKAAEDAFAQANCRLHVLLTFEELVRTAKDDGLLGSAEEELLRDWSGDPFGWGEKHGFPRVEK